MIDIVVDENFDNSNKYVDFVSHQNENFQKQLNQFRSSIRHLSTKRKTIFQIHQMF